MKPKSDCCFSVRFSFSHSLSLSAFFLISALLSDDEKKNHRTRFFFSLLLLLLLLLLLKLVLSLLCWGSFITKDDTAYAFSFAEWACVCFGRFALFLAYFLFWLLLSFGFGLCSAFYFGRTTSFLSPEEEETLFPSSIQCVGNTLKFLS